MEPKNPPKGNLQGSDAVLQALFENGNSPLSGPFLRWKMWKRWDEYVGPTIAEVTEPVGFYNGTLYVWVKNSTWIQQMSFMRDSLTKKLNEKLGGTKKIRRVQFTLNRNMVPTDTDSQEALKTWIKSLAGED